MKKSILIVLAFLLAFSLSAQEINTDTMVAEGSWIIEEGRLVQTDTDAPRAKFAIPYPQAGMVTYEFNVKYEDGILEDGHGGFGIHVFADDVHMGPAWGVDGSWLLWLNYDLNPEGISEGFSAQVYKSNNHSEMELIADYDMNWALDNLEEQDMNIRDILSQTVNVKIDIDARTGDVTFHSPYSDSYVYKFTLPIEEPLTGKFVVLRSNGMSLSFAY